MLKKLVRDIKLAKIVMIVILLITIIAGNSITVKAKEAPFSVNAHAYIVIDAHTGKALYSYNADKKSILQVLLN